jgi:hypothetical protein
MPIRNASSDSQEISLRRWRVIEIEAQDGARSRHVWGHDAANNKGRASSAIVEFDRDSMTATTRSGKSYRLIGLPGNSRLGKTAWNNWCNKNEVVVETDVTREYLNIEQVSTVGFEKINNSLSQ